MSRNPYAEQARRVQRDAQIRGELRHALRDKKHLHRLLNKSSGLLRTIVNELGPDADLEAFLAHVGDILDVTSEKDAKTTRQAVKR